MPAGQEPEPEVAASNSGEDPDGAGNGIRWRCSRAVKIHDGSSDPEIPEEYGGSEDWNARQDLLWP